MGKNTLIALISLGFVSTTALVLGIVGVANNGHDCGFEKGEMMGRAYMMQGQSQGQKGMMNNQRMRLPGSGTIPAEQAIAE